MRARIKTEIWVQAYLRRCAFAGAAAFVARRGDGDAGAVIVKISTLDGGARVYRQSIRGDGDVVWREATKADDRTDDAAERVIARERDIDPDIWVVETEDKTGTHHLTEPVYGAEERDW